MVRLVFLVVLVGSALGDRPLCSEQERVELPSSEENTIQAHGLNFTQNTFWRENGKVFGCPCKIKPCLTKCYEDGENAKIILSPLVKKIHKKGLNFQKFRIIRDNFQN